MSSQTKGPGGRPTFTDQEALLFHSQGRPGKLEVVATKPMATQRDLSLAYSPGVAVPVLAIAEDAGKAYDYTTKGNFVVGFARVLRDRQHRNGDAGRIGERKVALGGHRLGRHDFELAGAALAVKQQR